MSPDRLSRIQELYHAALERQPDERDVFLTAACQGDGELRNEVKSLLEHQSASLLDGPAWEKAPSLFGRDTLVRGAELGPYRVIEAIGSGGMGEVYRAKDSRLGREVAIKVLPEHLAQDRQARARFEREARAVAALNHPHICSLYDVGPDYLVMELVEGQTLAERIARGAIPLEEALAIAGQIGEALEAAHEKGVIHRDLKPANIIVKPDGVVKVLDFGLAAIWKGIAPAADEVEKSRERTETLSGAGMILGTAAYMSPEQARGEAVDKRTDIWAFGVVLYEMLTGRRVFAGESTTEILAAVLTQEPDWDQVPVKVQRLLRRCLEKDTKRRLRDIGDVAVLAEDSPPVQDLPRSTRVPWAVAAAFAMVAVTTFAYLRRAPEEPRFLKFSVLAPANTTLSTTAAPAVSPDGRRLAFLASTDGRDSLWVRDLDSLVARRLPGTEDAGNPFWSPDSRFLAFFAPGKLKKIDVAGGPALPVADVVSDNGGGSWSKSSGIIFEPSPPGTIFRAPDAGGNAIPVTAIERALSEKEHSWPWFLPDGRHFLYTAMNESPDKTNIYLGEVDSKNRHRALAVSSNAVYSPPGYLLFVHEGSLVAQPFDAAKSQTTGDPVLLAEGVIHNNNGVGNALFSVSQNGILAYISGEAFGTMQLTWYDPSGQATGTVGAPADQSLTAVSPDGTRVAVGRVDPQTGFSDLWVHDLARGTASRLTFGLAVHPVWSPNGSQIAFNCSSREQAAHVLERLCQKSANGEGQEQTLDEGPLPRIPQSWSADGRYIVEAVFDPKTKGDIWVLPLFGDRKPFPYLRSEFEETSARLSPDGHWLVYDSDETNRKEVYVQAFPVPGGKVQVSKDGGKYPIWSRDGKKLFFLAENGDMMAADVKTGLKFQASVPRRLFNASFAPGFFDVSRDGRFLISTPKNPAGMSMTVLVNWTAGLKK